MLASSGTGGMEGIGVEFPVSRRQGACVSMVGSSVNGGAKICKAFGVQVTEMKGRVGHAQSIPKAVADALKKPILRSRPCMSKPVRPRPAVSHDVKALGEIVKGYEEYDFGRRRDYRARSVLDIKTDAWGLDVVITGSQKALMLPPGLGLRASVSEKAWRLADKAKNAAFYFNFKRERENQAEEHDRLYAGRVPHSRPERSDEHSEGRGARSRLCPSCDVGDGDA
jgi:aspartate aminotransferase-like enzyme